MQGEGRGGGVWRGADTRAMPNLKYLRPKTLDEAMEQLASGVALGGGATLAPRRIPAGAGCPLQQLVEAEGIVAPALAEACRREAAWNLRNVATLAGAVLACDGRSPLASALLAVGAKALLIPGEESISLDDLLDRRPLDAEVL